MSAKPSKICITGANGFIGRTLSNSLSMTGKSVVAVVRSRDRSQEIDQIEYVENGDINLMTDWSSALQGVDCVIHCAALTKSTQQNAKIVMSEYRRVNVEGSKHLAEAAAKMGVKRIVYISSIKVNGEYTEPGRPFSISDDPNPSDPYGISKWEAEQALWEVAAKTGLEVVIIRPPLVYGPGVKGNMARLNSMLRSGIPFPFASIENRRSLIGIENLISYILLCLDNPKAAGKTLLVSDGEDVSTPDLLRYIAFYSGVSLHLFSVPEFFFTSVGKLLGQQSALERLIGSLQIDSRPAADLFSWNRPHTLEEGIRRMVESV